MTVRRLGLAAAYWVGSIRRPVTSDAPTLLLCFALVFTAWAWRPVAPNLWAVEHQTNVSGKDVIIRCRDESFCPIPEDDLDNDGSSLVDTDL